MNANVDQRLDCLGLYCPEPVNRTSLLVRQMEPGQVLEVIGDDPGMQIDIPAWCMSHGHTCLDVEIQAGQIHCYLRIAG